MDNRFFTLPFTFDAAALQQDLATCQHVHWQQHFNQRDYTGHWTSIALRSASGQITDIAAPLSVQTFVDTSLLAQCPYFSEILNQFNCPNESVRLLSLAPGSAIREHTDPQTSYANGFFRLHVPIQTPVGVQFRVDGCTLPMRVGECWYANFELPHSVENQGSTSRVHLVIDCLRNAWSDALFAEAGYDFKAETTANALPDDTKRQMLAELERMDSDAARQLITQLQHELTQSHYE